MNHPKALCRTIVKGIAFPVPELIILSAWAEFHALEMRIDLDHCVDNEEYEEIIAFYAKGDVIMQCFMWRSSEHIVLQPRCGQARRFAAIGDALDAAVAALAD